MKKIFLVLLMICVCVVLTSCTFTENQTLLLDYDKTTRTCTVINVDDMSYDKVEVVIDVQVDGGFKKEIKRQIGDIDAGGKYTFELTEIAPEAQVQSVALTSYNHYIPGIVLILVGLVGIAIIVLFAAILSLIFD